MKAVLAKVAGDEADAGPGLRHRRGRPPATRCVAFAGSRRGRPDHDVPDRDPGPGRRRRPGRRSSSTWSSATRASRSSPTPASGSREHGRTRLGGPGGPRPPTASAAPAGVGRGGVPAGPVRSPLVLHTPWARLPRAAGQPAGRARRCVITAVASRVTVVLCLMLRHAAGLAAGAGRLPRPVAGPGRW